MSRYLSSFLLVLIYFLFQNLLGFLYAYYQLTTFSVANYVRFDLFVTLIVGSVVFLIIYFKKIPVIFHKFNKLNFVRFVFILVVLCAVKILLNELKYFDPPIPPEREINPSDKVYLFVNNSFLKPITEELFFRVILLFVLIRNNLNLSKILYSSILFTLVHVHFGSSVSIYYISSVAVIGLFLVLIYLNYGLIYSFIAHSVINILSFINHNHSISKPLGDLLGEEFFIFSTVLVLVSLVFLFIKEFKYLRNFRRVFPVHKEM